MLFHRKHQENEALQTVKTLTRHLSGQIEELKALSLSHSEKLDNLCSKTDGIENDRAEMQKLMRRQTGSFEDLLEEFQDQMAQTQRYEQLLKEAKAREQALLSLICCCREQMDLTAGQISRDETMDPHKKQAWQEQFRLMEQEDVRLMALCAMEETGVVGEPVDYGIHEVLKAIDTNDDSLAGTVAEVCCRGRIYGGNVLKKAIITAYRKEKE